MTVTPLFAADLIQTIFGVVVFLLWAIGQYVGSREEAKRKDKVRRPRPQQEPELIDLAEVGERPPKQRPRNQEDALRSEVEDFLRRAQGKSEQPKPAQQAEAKQQPRPPRQRPSRQDRPKRRSPSQRETVSQQPPTLRTEGVAEHVQRHLSTDDLSTRAEALGESVATADDRVESRLHEKFDHDVGRLEHRDTPANDASSKQTDIAAEVAEMLRSPQGVRQIIIANEILRRPEW